MPSQQSSLRGTRTALTPHEAIAAIEAASVGPSNMPQPWAHAYSLPERLTPATRNGAPAPSTIRLPDTCRPGGATAALALVVATAMATITAATIAANSFRRLVMPTSFEESTTGVQVVDRLLGTASPKLEVARLAYVPAIPTVMQSRERPMLGPDTVSWRVNREPVVFMGGGRALLLQVAHPLVAPGAAQHSDYQPHPPPPPTPTPAPPTN